MKILLVDDDEDTCALLALLLEREGWSPTAVATVAEARAALAAGGHEVLIADHHLPDGTGLELPTLARASGVRVCILATGDTSGPRPEHFDLLVPKPVDVERVIAELRQRLAVGAR